MWVSNAASAHYRAVAKEETLLLAAARKAWRNVEPDWAAESWSRIVQQEFMPVVAASQSKVALLGSEASAAVLADQGFGSHQTGLLTRPRLLV